MRKINFFGTRLTGCRMIKIFIPKSRSAKFGEISKMAETLNGTIQQEGISIVLLDSKIFQSLDGLYALSKLTSALRNVETTYNNKKLNLYQLVRRLMEVRQCSESYSKIDKKHCWRNTLYTGWGCRFLTDPILHLRPGSNYKYDKYWYNHGMFSEDESEWIVNKALILHKLANSAERSGASLCPYFNHKRILKTVNELPEKIKVDNVYYEKYFMRDFEGAEIKYKPINIRHVCKPSEQELREKKRRELIKKYEFQIAAGELYGKELEKTVNSLRMLKSKHFVYNLNIIQDSIIDNIQFSDN